MRNYGSICTKRLQLNVTNRTKSVSYESSRKLALPLLFRGNAKCGLASASMAEEKLLTHFDIAQLHGDIGVG